MSDIQALLNELSTEIERGKKWGYNYVTHPRLESLVRKYSETTPGDISDQPGQWQIRGGNVDAIQHTGTVASGQQLLAWVNDHGGEATWFQENGYFYIRLDSPREPNIVGPDWWIVHTADGIFYAVSDAEFHIIYVPRGSTKSD